MNVEIFDDIVLNADGGTYQMNTMSPYTIGLITGSAVMTSSWTISTTGSLFKGMKAVLSYQATMTFGVNTLTILGKNIPSSLQEKPFHIIGIYDGTVWKTIIIPDIGTDESVPGASIVQSSMDGNRLMAGTVSLLKLVSLAEGNIIIGNNSAVATALDISTDAGIMIGNGTTAVPRVISGDLTIDNLGVATIPNGTITEDQLEFPLGSEFLLSADLDETSIQTLFSEPYIVYPTAAVAANEAVSIVQAYVKLDSAGEAFAFTADVAIQTISGQTLATFTGSALEGTTDRIVSATITDVHDLILNNGIQVIATGANPTGGANASLHFRITAKKYTF